MDHLIVRSRLCRHLVGHLFRWYWETGTMCDLMVTRDGVWGDYRMAVGFGLMALLF